MKQVTLSVIVPVFNGEAYIDRAMKGILSQTLYDLEVIVVNDGSTDCSLKKLKKWSEQDARVILVDKENEGVSIARNLGMNKASGKYLTFLDVDDYLEPDAYERMVDSLEKSGSQAALCSFFSEYKDEIEQVLLPWKTGTLLTKKEIWEQLIPWMIKVYPEDGISTNIFGSVWRLCVSREAWKMAGVEFDPKLHIAEDFDFCIRLYSKLEKISIIKEPLYHYIRWENTTLAVYRKNQFQEGIDNQMRLKHFLEEEGKYEQLKRRFVGSYVDVCIGSLVNFVRPGAPPKKQVRKELKSMVEQIATSPLQSEFSKQPLTRNQKLVLWLIKRKWVRLILLLTEIRQKRKG